MRIWENKIQAYIGPIRPIYSLFTHANQRLNKYNNCSTYVSGLPLLTTTCRKKINHVDFWIQIWKRYPIKDLHMSNIPDTLRPWFILRIVLSSSWINHVEAQTLFSCVLIYLHFPMRNNVSFFCYIYKIHGWATYLSCISIYEIYVSGGLLSFLYVLYAKL